MNTMLQIMQAQAQAAQARADEFMKLLLAERNHPAKEDKDPLEVAALAIERLDRIRPPKGAKLADPEHPGLEAGRHIHYGSFAGIQFSTTSARQKMAQAPPPQQQQPKPAAARPAAQQPGASSSGLAHAPATPTGGTKDRAPTARTREAFYGRPHLV